MRLFIAEKPSLGRAIADVLPKPHRKAEGCIYVGNGDCVSWCVGHLLEQVEPDAYDAKYKQWRLEHLPIVPEHWQLKPKASSRKQLSVLRKLVKEADQLIHAGDPDREGQLLVDQVIDHLKVKGSKREAIQRCLISDLNPSAVIRALNQLVDNKAFAPLSISALARSRADWLYGINMTRALTLQGRKVGYQGVLSVGRVQTPLLGMVVRRDREIERFVAKPFYQVFAHLKTSEGEDFKAKWQPSEACAKWQDEEGRVIAKPLAANVAARITDQAATVVKSSRKLKKQPPPLPYNLSALQIDAAKRFSMSAKQVLDSCQTLYERHKLLTYPRSDCRYLPKQHFADRERVLSAIASNAERLSEAVAGVDTALTSKAWNDARVSAHHAIVPTARQASTATLSSAERNIYELVSRQYIAQFYPAHEYSDSQIDLEIGGGLFIAKARQSVFVGWKMLYPGKGGDKPELASNTRLPALDKGASCHCVKGEVVEKLTSPPKPFDDASLLAAMTGVGRYVKDPDIRKVLKETDGLGTEATRAGIIELLFHRGFLARKSQGGLGGKAGKKTQQIHATAAGKGLISSLPEVATLPDMTAQWETQLEAISLKSIGYQGFMQPLQCSLVELIDQSQSVLPVGLKDIKAKPAYKKFRKRRAATGNASKRVAAGR